MRRNCMTRRTFAITGLTVAILVSSFATSSWADRDNGQRRNGVNVIEATFGGTTVPIHVDACPVIEPGNVTAAVHDACQGLKTCEFTVDPALLGDPASGCWKSFEVTYQCAQNSNATRTVSIPASPDGADHQSVALTCPIK
jgi:hypothetical protein